MALIIGIDPGKSGAVAAITEAGAVVRLDDTPLVAGGYDVAAMAGMLSTYRPEDVALVVLEQSQAMPGQGVTSMFTVGVGFGLWWGIVATLGLPLEFVRPCVWVRAILKGQPGEGKARALGYVARRFPGAELTPPRCRAPRDGRADALCLAVWGMGRRNMGLGTY